MTDGSDDGGAGWFVDVAPDDVEAAARSIVEGSAEEPRAWPALAVDAGVVDSEAAYYDRLHDASMRAARHELRERERAGDQQLIHAVRAMDDCSRTANELAERVAEWGHTALDGGNETDDAPVAGVEYARLVADREPAGPTEARLGSLADRVVGLADEADELRGFVERTAHDVAPNLAALAGPVLAARLIALAGGLESLARMPSSTVQVLGAEDALFAHLRGDAPSPKHGAIFTHEYVRGTDPANRGSAARALAGKLSIAARIDHYSGDRRPELERELDDRIRRIQSRDGDSGVGEASDADRDGGGES